MALGGAGGGRRLRGDRLRWTAVVVVASWRRRRRPVAARGRHRRVGGAHVVCVEGACDVVERAAGRGGVGEGRLGVRGRGHLVSRGAASQRHLRQETTHRSVAGQSPVNRLSVTGQSPVSHRSVTSQSPVSHRSITGHSC